MLFESQMGNETAPNAERGVHAASACAAALPFSLSSQKRRRGPGRGGRFTSLSPLSNSLPARSSRGEREKRPQRFSCRTQLVANPQTLRRLQSLGTGDGSADWKSAIRQVWKPTSKGR